VPFRLILKAHFIDRLILKANFNFQKQMISQSKFFLLGMLFIASGQPAQFIFAIMKADAVTATIMLTLYFSFTGLFGIPLSRLSDRLMRRKVFSLCGFLLVAIVFMGYYFIPPTASIPLIISAALVGLGNAFYNPTSYALFSELEPKLSHGKLMSYYYVVASAGWSFGAILGGFFFQYFGELTYFFSGSLCLIGFCISFLFVHDVPLQKANIQAPTVLNNSSLTTNLRRCTFIIIIVSIAVLTRHIAAQGGLVALLPNYISEELHADTFTTSLILAVNMASQSVLMLPVGRLVDSNAFGRKSILLLGILASDIAVLSYSFIPIPWLIIFPQMLVGFAWPAIITASTAMVTDLTTRHNRSWGMGLLNAGFSIGGSLGPIISGAILIHYDTNFILAFQILAIFPLIGIILILVTLSESRATNEYFLFHRKVDIPQEP
jgi:MFS family permease